MDKSRGPEGYHGLDGGAAARAQDHLFVFLPTSGLTEEEVGGQA